VNHLTKGAGIWSMQVAKGKYKTSSRYDFLGVGLLFLSFVYDRPFLHITGLWRLDPRPFDVVFGGVLLYVLFNKNRLRTRMSAYWYMKRPLLFLIMWFFVVVLLQFLWIPAVYQKYSVYFLLRYIQLYVAVWFVATSALSNDERIRVVRLFLLTVIVVTVIGILQFTGFIQYTRLVGQGIAIDMTGWGLLGKEVRITSTLGIHYAYFGQYSVLGIALSVLLFLVDRRRYSSLFLAVLSMVFGLIGVLLSQSLSAIVTLLVFMCSIFILGGPILFKYLRQVTVIVILIVLFDVWALLYAPMNLTERAFSSWNSLRGGVESVANPTTSTQSSVT